MEEHKQAILRLHNNPELSSAQFKEYLEKILEKIQAEVKSGT